MEFRILGPLEVDCDGRKLSLGGAKQRALLAILLLHANEVVSTDRLVDELWDDRAPATAAKVVHVYVSNLRKALRAGRTAPRGEDGQETVLVTRPTGYMLQVERDELDADRFEKLVEQGRAELASGRPRLAAPLLVDALALWRGPALADFVDDDFARTEIGRLEEARVSALEERIEADLALGRHAEIVAELESLVANYPLRERLQGQLMLALYRSGRQAEALVAYNAARHVLVEELGLEPGPRLQELQKAILVQDPSLEPAAVRVEKVNETARSWLRPNRRTLLAAILAAAIAGAVGALLLTRGDGSTASASIRANSLAFVDADSAELTSQVPVGASPAGVAAGPDAIWVTNADDQTVSQIDPRTKAVVQTIEVGAGPAGITTGAGAAWVVNALDGTVSRIDPKTRSVVWTKPVGSGPTAMTYGPDGLWVANSGDSTVVKLDPTTGEVVRTLGVEAGASGIADGFGSLWVSSERTGNVIRMDPKHGAVIRTIHVGNGPRALALGKDSVWVANTLDGTVSRIDPRSSTQQTVVTTGQGPSGIAVGPRAVWVANDAGASLARIDTETNPPRVQRVPLGNPAKGVAVAGGSVLVAVRAQGEAHRGGTLTVYSGRRSNATIDPSTNYESYGYAIPSLTYDGLVAFKHVGGSDGSTLVPGLASSLPLPTDKGKTYTFELRPGIRYSTGRAVRAQDFRRGIERAFRLRSYGRGWYSGILGAARCEEKPRSCDLSKGITVDDDARLVTFHLAAADPDFLYKLTMPYAGPIPPGTPNRDVGTRAVPATGPYKIARYVPKREIVFVRNPYFRARAARPDGYPDRIVWRLDVGAAAATRAVERGLADVAYDFVPEELLTEVRARYASQLHVDPIPGTYFYFFDARFRPFSDRRVRQALNYAVDRNAVIEVSRAGAVAQPTCQVLPPNFPGYRPYCPYTANPSAGNRWVAPDLDRARRLVAASGTKGERVTVWTADGPEGAYVASVLRRLGYRTRLRTVTPFTKYDAAIVDPRNKVQVGALRWYPDYPAASGFISNVIFNCSGRSAVYFCDRRINRQIARARALQPTDPQAANALWTKIDRMLTDEAPWLFLYNNKQADFVSERVGNFQYNLQYGILLDQLWVK